ncbi:potassium transporter 4 isoform X2 [Physcomitrium patens]|uniref:Potassium transporter n=1 Tax=Physcomitrium patens TaxID=3218 RepID=A0A7I4CCU5_PHYPA|nr:potassium transporter 4-like isoform X2 [Physcomitrium patens]|eukprot:XP_024361335.1 potassium transporter 4-like isoform X2 [Physcomitrella patens]
MDPESPNPRTHGRSQSMVAVLMLAYQSFGVVYGDLCVSPLYVFRSTFSGDLRSHMTEGEISGVLSLIFWTLTLVPVIKYAIIILNADDNGEGGTFALYSLLCRHAKLSLILNRQNADSELLTHNLEQPPETPRGQTICRLLEKHVFLRNGLIIVVLLGSCMVIGNGILTPSIAVLSATSGISVAAPQLPQSVAVLVSCGILVLLFGLQHLGTHRISFMFAPIVLMWLFCNCAVGIYNLVTYNPLIIHALSPYYIYHFFKVSGRDGWISLGGVLLCITGSEAMYADLGHFSKRSIKTAFTCIVYPCLVLGYMGQAAYLSKNLADVDHGFFHSIPGPVFWPVFIVGAVTATFSIIKQCQSLGFVPWVKVVHTSRTIHGQIYIPEINWIMFVISLSITVGFQSPVEIGNAYGISVICVMLATTLLMTFVIYVVWQHSIFTAGIFFLVFTLVEAVYLSSALFKVKQGGWVALVLAGVIMSIMYVWHYGTIKNYEFDLQNKVSMKWLLTLGPGLGIVRVPGIGLIYTELLTGVPAIFSHFVTNLPAFHQILVFVCIKSAPVPFVPPDERYLVGRVGCRDYRMYRYVVRSGYKDTYTNDESEFESQLIYNLAEFIRTESAAPWAQSRGEMPQDSRMTVMGALGSTRSVAETAWSTDMPANAADSLESSDGITSPKRHVHFNLPKPSDNHVNAEVRKELADLADAKEAGIAYVMGHSYVRAKPSSSWLKKFAINFVYSFLRRNCREPAVALNIPHTSLIQVGMVYYV